MNKFIFIFFTHSGAIKFDRKMKTKNINCELMPVPRNLSSNCGIGAVITCNESYNSFIDDEVEKVFSSESQLLFDAE